MKIKNNLIAGILGCSVGVLTACSTVSDLAGKVNETMEIKKSPGGVVVAGDSYMMGSLTLDNIRDNYIVALDQDNTIFAEIEGEARFYGNKDGIVYFIESKSEKLSFYEGIKVGMKEKDIERKLGESSIEDVSCWYYDADGNRLTGANSLGAEYEISVEYDSTLLGWISGNEEVIEITLTKFSVK